MRILIMTDSLNIPTGQGRVGRELAIGLQKRGHEIGYIGWWHGSNTSVKTPAGITYWGTNNEHYGSDILDRIVMIFQPDVVLTVGDFWRIGYIADTNRCRTRRLFQWCSYIPVDGEPKNGGLPPSIVPIVADIDMPVAYTNYAKEAVLKSVNDQETRNRLRVIYHGVDTNVFKPMNPSDRLRAREAAGIGDKFVFLTVCRNQSRKNIPEMFSAWDKFSQIPEVAGNVMFWPHMNFKDPNGWDIDDLMTVHQMRNQSIMYYHSMAYGPSSHDLVQERDLAKLYGMADAFLLISGEGFGLPILEAMATGLPCILLDHSAPAELGADGRAELVPWSDHVTWTGGHLTKRPVPRVEDIVEAMKRIYMNRRHATKIADKGREFASRYTWDAALNEWNALFLEHEIPFLKPLKLEVVI